MYMQVCTCRHTYMHMYRYLGVCANNCIHAYTYPSEAIEEATGEDDRSSTNTGAPAQVGLLSALLLLIGCGDRSDEASETRSAQKTSYIPFHYQKPLFL